MTKISLLLFLFLCSNLLFAQEQADISERQDITLEIIPTKHGKSSLDTARISLSNLEGWHFHVLLTNNSVDTISIWAEYPYSRLHFEIEYPDGRKTVSYKKNLYYSNIFLGPLPISIPPNGHYIFDVTFSSDTSNLNGFWSNTLLDEAIDSEKTRTKIPCKMKAIYENKATRTFGTTKEMWTGIIESKVDDYIVVYYQFDKPVENEKTNNKKSRREKKQ